MMYHKISYYIYADDTQLYISFKCKQPLEAISKLTRCLSNNNTNYILGNKLAYSRDRFATLISVV